MSCGMQIGELGKHLSPRWVRKMQLDPSPADTGKALGTSHEMDLWVVQQQGIESRLRGGIYMHPREVQCSNVEKRQVEINSVDN